MTKKQTSLFPDESRKKDLTILRGLDRSGVEPLAFKILTEIEPFCVRAEIAGSIRRQKGTVNDIDLVVQPKASDSWINIIKFLRHDYAAITGKQGDKLATLYVLFASKQGLGHIQVDLYRATRSTWGILLLVRTGSAEHNVHLCNLALAKGLRLQYSQGLVDSKGNVIAGKTEEEVFEALGLPFILPQDREVKSEEEPKT
jgi:DNA polymerase (family 10)